MGKSGDSAAGAPPPLSDGPHDEPGYWRRKAPLIIYTVLLLLTSVGNQVYFKRMTSAMPNYGWYLTQLSSVIYIPFFGLLAGSSAIQNTKNDLMSKFAVMGVFDGLSGTLMVLGGVHTSGTMQVLLGQAVIPLTMAFSFFMLRKRFHLLQQTGAAIIILGIVLAKVPSGGAGGEGVSGQPDNPVFNTIFFLAVVPSALSSVFKEVAFRGSDGDLDINMLQFWVAVFQVCTNFLAMPIYTLEVLGEQRMPLSEMPGITVGGSRCLFMLEDQVMYDCGLPTERPCDHCQDAWVPVAMYLGFNLLYNIFTMLVIKHGSAALSFLVATLRMPLASLAFSSPLIMGQEAVQPGLGDVLGLVVILSGLCTYRYGGKLLKRQARREALASADPVKGSGFVSPSGNIQSSWLSPSDILTPLTRSCSGSAGATFGWRLAPLVTAGMPGLQPMVVLVRDRKPRPRSAGRLRSDLYQRLGAASPLNSPELRRLTPSGRGSPGPGAHATHAPPAAAGDLGPALLPPPAEVGLPCEGEGEGWYSGSRRSRAAPDITLVGLPPA